jgi:hypothetical protein
VSVIINAVQALAELAATMSNKTRSKSEWDFFIIKHQYVHDHLMTAIHISQIPLSNKWLIILPDCSKPSVSQKPTSSPTKWARESVSNSSSSTLTRPK